MNGVINKRIFVDFNLLENEDKSIISIFLSSGYKMDFYVDEVVSNWEYFSPSRFTLDLEHFTERKRLANWLEAKLLNLNLKEGSHVQFKIADSKSGKIMKYNCSLKEIGVCKGGCYEY